MKHRLAIWAILMVIFMLFAFTLWTVRLAFGTDSANPQKQKTITLCFDDGPKLKVLKELLPILEKHGVLAHFFMIAGDIMNNRTIIKQMHDAGHRMENHSWGHENLKKLFKEKGADGIKNSVLKAETAIRNITERKPKFFRPPLWEINNEIEKIISSLGYTVMKLEKPDINTMDYADASKDRPAETLIERVKNIIASREKQKIFNHVLVFHELSVTAEALKTLIPYFQSQGYKFVPLEASYQR